MRIMSASWPVSFVSRAITSLRTLAANFSSTTSAGCDACEPEGLTELDEPDGTVVRFLNCEPGAGLTVVC